MKMLLLSSVGVLALFVSPLQAHEQKDVSVTRLLSAIWTSSGQPIRLPQKDAQIIASIFDVTPLWPHDREQGRICSLGGLRKIELDYGNAYVKIAFRSTL
jgi:hypothetical protein